jgi:hypothetical protein
MSKRSPKIVLGSFFKKFQFGGILVPIQMKKRFKHEPIDQTNYQCEVKDNDFLPFFVQCSIIHHHPQCVILLLHKENR